MMRRLTPSDVNEVDVLVIGGGVTGAAAARDAAMRGLSTALVERDDFAAGTSSRSSKLVHGGLRYLQTYQFAMVHESVRERERMMRLAPHLAQLRPFLYMCYRGYPEGKALLNLGLTFYDVFSFAPPGRWHRLLGRQGVLAREPHLNPSGLTGAGLFHDALTDDARVTLDTLRSAVEAGAVVGNYLEVTGFTHHGGRLTGALVRDRLEGSEFEIRARAILNCAGPWVDEVRSRGLAREANLAGRRPAPLLRPTKGVHIVLRYEDFPLDTALFMRSPSDGRVVWPIPTLDGRHVYIGTTDTDYEGSLDDVRADDADYDYLFAVANHAMPDARLDRSHIVASWAGLRPLVAPPDEMSAGNVPREHQIVVGEDGLITIAGGKLTTARVMGEQVVDAAVAALVERGDLSAPRRSATADAYWSGGSPQSLRAAFATLRRVPGLPGTVRSRWISRYGGNALEMADAARADAGACAPLDEVLTRAELAHAIDHDMARTVADVMVRRTGEYFWSADGAMAAAEVAADLLADRFSWTPARRAADLDAYRTLVSTNRPS